MKFRRNGMFIWAVIMAFLSGCLSDTTGTTYSLGEVRQMQLVRFGTVEDVRMVKLEGSSGEVGSMAGAAIGGVAGSGIGGRREHLIGGVAGAVAGGVLGNMVEKKLTVQQGVELTIRLDDGAYISVVQQADPNSPFSNGARVKVLTQGASSRVVKIQ